VSQIGQTATSKLVEQDREADVMAPIIHCAALGRASALICFFFFLPSETMIGGHHVGLPILLH